MFTAGRGLVLIPLLLLAGCQRPSCCNVNTPVEEKPAAPAEKPADKAPPDVTAVGPNSAPMFGGTINRNLANEVEKGIASTWAAGKGKNKNIKWVAKLGSISYGGPVIAGGRIFVGTNNDSPRDPAIKGDKGVLMCFAEADGRFLWQIVHDKNDSSIDAERHGVLSTPAIDGNRLYYVSNKCELVCADVAGDPKAPGKGKIVWSLDMMKDLNVYPGGLSGSAPNSSPLVLGDLVYVLTSQGADSATQKPKDPKAPTLIAVDRKSGKVRWSDNSPGNNIMDGQWSSPAAAEIDGEKLIVYGGGDGWVYCLEATKGELRWKFDCNPKSSRFKPGGRGNRGFIIATPVIYDKKVYVAVASNPEDGDGAGRLWCIDITKKPTKKDKDVSPYSNPINVEVFGEFNVIPDPNPKFDPKDPRNKDSALVWHYGGLVEPKGKPEDREFVFGRTLSTVAVHDGLVYAAEIAGFLQCIDAKTGKKYWSYDLQDGTWSSPYYVDGKVFLSTNTGNMFVFTPGKEFKEPVKIAMEGSLEVPPVAVNGVLYLTNRTHLYAIAEKK